MRLGLRLPSTADRSASDFAVRAEELGYESVWQGELWGANAFAELAAVATRTNEVRLGTAIVNVYSRTPAVLAMGAASLDRLSGGRAILGLGVSTPTAIEGLHGMGFERPIRRTVEAGELVAAFLGGEGTVEYDGEVFEAADFPALDADVPVYNAALGPANRRATGRAFDGWLPNNVPFSNVGSAFETIAGTAREAGRDPDAIEIAPWVHVAVDDDDPGAARDLVRGTVAYYVGSGEGYEAAVGAVYPEAAERIASAWRGGDRDAARASVTDELVADLGCAGTTEDVREQLRRVVDETPVDLPIVNVPAGADDAVVERTVTAVAPEAL